ncbi:uncharacterized protein LOC112271480 [Brachypodium distachyon]|uniref:Aminotransferase-like plant mobile domain-containing protein n=1 Tax=Brachypodium distachyon TaxID=15368 RepID=A0A0Q3I3B0_BRADI|nr:uncharacterized protein LOC112271480 [Brachypodium distachyon]KQJ95051.2 hypothetical protein BRADI_3g14886v3 [Brachypodium distachyon]|eukprot:XP_024316393.1 uncharacterized protein LOC112271480 [Brachypodium distachyon]
MELSSPSSLNTTAGGGGHDHHESESEDSAEENNPKCRVQFISDSSYEDDDHINELEHTDSDNQHTKFFHDVTDMVLQGLKRKRRRKSMRKESRKRAKFGIQLAGGNEAEIVPKAYSRCNVHYLHEVIRSFRNCERKCGLIRGAGFGDILQFDGCIVPRSFAQWIADCTNVRTEEVCVGEQRIQLGTEHVASIVGIPSAGLTIQTTGEDGKISFLASIGLKELPPIKFFGSKVMNEDLPDDMFIRCVLVVVLSTFLCPTSSTFPSTKYLGALVDIDKIKDMDWAKLTHNWMINCIKKYQKQRAKRKRLTCTLGGCIYSLAVRCLDEVDFEGIHLEQTLPRILVWKGDMIIQYSKLYMCPNGKYGFLPVKENNKSSFSIANKKESREKLLMELKNFLECSMTQSLSSEVKENVVSIFDAYMGTEDEHCWEKAKRLLTDVLMSITTNCNIMLKEEHHNGNIGILSGDTEVAGSSQEASYNCEGASDNTLKVDSDGASTNEGTTNGERKKEQPPHSGDKSKQDSMEHKDVTTTQFESGNKGGDGMHFAHTVQELDGTNGNVTGLSNPIMPTVMELDTYAKDVNKDVHLTDHQYEKTSKLPTTDTSAVQNEIALHVPP